MLQTDASARALAEQNKVKKKNTKQKIKKNKIKEKKTRNDACARALPGKHKASAGINTACDECGARILKSPKDTLCLSIR